MWAGLAIPGIANLLLTGQLWLSSINQLPTLITSIDHIYFKKTETGCEVTYDALLELNGPLSFLDVAIKKMFKRIGDKAATGLAEALDGEVTEAKLVN